MSESRVATRLANWGGVSLCIRANVCLESPSTKSPIIAYGTRMMENFPVPSEQLSSERCGDTMRNLLDLMNIPFSLDDKLRWRHLSNSTEEKTLENSQGLIEQLVTKFHRLRDTSTASQSSTFVVLFIKKTVTLPDDEFEEWMSFRARKWLKYKRQTYDAPMLLMRWRRAALKVLERVRVENGGDANSGEGLPEDWGCDSKLNL